MDCSESFKSAENWTPICLPKFNSDGFLHGHVSYLADDCQACLLLLSIEKDDFSTLSEAKQKITEVYNTCFSVTLAAQRYFIPIFS